MCGIAGWIANTPLGAERIRGVKKNLAHRGPDDEGHWINPKSTVSHSGLIHTRLSIIDLSKVASQPMLSCSKQKVLSFNGEVYNYCELKSELEARGYIFNSDSDTEVFLHAYEEWGVTVFERISGMFAGAIMDLDRSKLIVFRDKFGIKPLYYLSGKSGVFFASEIQALITLAQVTARVNAQTAYDYLALGQTDYNSDTFFKGIYSLPSAHYAEISLDLDVGKLSVVPKRYWEMNGSRENSDSEDELSNQLRFKILDSVEKHMRSDVAIGASLSGGIDSSAIVCSMRNINPNAEIHTFSFLPRGRPYCEERWVDQVNETVSAISHKVIFQENGLLDDLDHLITQQGEPFGSTSVYAQYKVFQTAKASGIKVLLDGQGADELFAGYPSHKGALLAGRLSNFEYLKAARLLASGTGHSDQGRGYLVKVAGHYLLPQSLYATMRNISGEGNRHGWLDLKALCNAGVDFGLEAPIKRGESILHEALKHSLSVRSLPQYLRYEDRNSMAHSVEGRVPFLTPKIAEFAYSLPTKYLISNSGQTKYLLRKALSGLVPDTILSRNDKVGFQAPLVGLPEILNRNMYDMLEQAEKFPWIRVGALRAEWKAIIESNAPYNSKVWRWVNYLQWARIFGVG